MDSNELDDDERIDTQEDLIYYEKLLYMFRQSEKQSFELREVQAITIPVRKNKD